MQIVIPMSGIGKRFIEAGYTTPKPFIPVEGRPIIEHIVRNFPGDEDNILFICNQEHLENKNYRDILLRIAPKGRIFPIKPHKLGPVFACVEAYSAILDAEPTVVNYCDFSWTWNYGDFKSFVSSRKCDGAVAAYRGFHPHLLHPNLYASMRVSDDNRMLEIREKHSFTPRKEDSFQSSGTYYFASGAVLKKYFNRLIEKKKMLNGEYYVSMVYNELVDDGLNVAVYEIPRMLQWGTPDDLEEYLYWSNYFRKGEKNESR